MTDTVTVVIPFRGDPSRPRRLLEELARQASDTGIRLPVIVSDDASDVPFAPSIEGDHLSSLDLRVVRSDRNRGPGGARNLALTSVTSPWSAFLDADVVPLPGWLPRLLSLLASNDADVIEGRVEVPDDDRATPFSHATAIEPPASRGAGNIVFRTEVLRRAGGFDERFYDVGRRLHFREDAELAFRLEALGAVFRYDADLAVAHPPLPASFWVPVRLARRYYFDPLLDRLHPDAFRSMNGTRRVGPVSLRRARHLAATAFVVGLVLLLVALATGLTVAIVVVLALVAGAWAANIVALAWGRRVDATHVLPLLAAGAIVPVVYVWNHWRGVLRFRHRPSF